MTTAPSAYIGATVTQLAMTRQWPRHVPTTMYSPDYRHSLPTCWAYENSSFPPLHQKARDNLCSDSLTVSHYRNRSTYQEEREWEDKIQSNPRHSLCLGQGAVAGSSTHGNKHSRTGLFWIITQRVVVIPYRRFGTTYRSHLRGVKNPRRPLTT
jgi:hypothetical protein